MSATHSNSLKMPLIEIEMVFPFSSLMMSVNLIQYRGTVGMFNNRCFASNNLNYSCFSKKYHNYDTFTLAIGLIVLTF